MIARAHLNMIQRDYFLREEAELRSLLGRWVSELDPVMVFRFGRFVGLGVDLEGFDVVVLPVSRSYDDYIDFTFPMVL